MASKIAAQMYTVRDFTKTAQDLSETLRKIRKIGYQAVQMSAIGAMNGDKPEVSAKDGRKMLDDNGLKCIATHRPWESYMEHTDFEIDFHHQLGCDFTAIGMMPESYRKEGSKGFSRFAKDCQPLIQRLKAAGIRFGYHNHDLEFQRVSTGKTLYDILIEEGGPDLTLELDVYWADHAGVNPVRIFERCPGRIPVIHVKDKTFVEGEGPVQAPIGEGNLDWDGLISAFEKAKVEWVAVEQDICRRDPFDCFKASYDFLIARGV